MISSEAFHYDVLVIGGGIQGCGVAQASAAQGWRTLLLEKSDALANGTSSKSSKLIHGGLRYLETAQFSLVKECLKERKILCEIAPELVQLRPFNIPLYIRSSRSPWLVMVGLFIYWALSGFRSDSKFRRVPVTHESCSEIDKNGLRAILQYYDAQTDDRRLTQAVMKSAQSYGAEYRLSQQVVKIESFEGGYKVFTKTDIYTTKVLVNACGPWLNQISNCFTNKASHYPVSLVKGSHIILDLPRITHCFFVESPRDKRPVFVLPWNDKVLVGTTESIYTGDLESVECNEQEQAYLLEALNYYFPNLRAEEQDVCYKFAGLRVLPIGEGNINDKSRDTLIFECDINPGYFTICGGKLTGYRITAEKIVKKIQTSLHEQWQMDSGPYVSTAKIKL